MEVFRGSWSSFSDVRDSAVTVGFFDGLHRGHRAIIEHVTDAASAQALRSVVLTFDAHPRQVLNDGASPVPLLTTVDEKLALFQAQHVDLALVIHFDNILAQLSPADFIQIILKGRVGMRKIVVGFNHGFGKQRSGDRETLIAMSKSLGFSVDVVNPTRLGDTIVSSSYLRELVADGQVAKADEGLGRWYTMRGTVIHGLGRGRQLGFPTANLGLIAPDKLSPRDGIYAGLARVHGETFPAAISLGNNPTFVDAKHSVEAHLLGFDRDIYDEEVELQFVERIRSEKKFASVDDLIAQIGEDVRTVSSVLKTKGLMQDVA